MTNPSGRPVVFDGHSAPDVAWSQFRSVSPSQVVSHEGASFREYLEDVVLSLLHRLEYAINEIRRDFLVEEVAHRIHKDHSRTFP